jgi:hypothetical protein
MAAIALLIAASMISQQFAVAGIKLRDAPQDVRTALTAAGYEISIVKQTDSYAQRLNDARAIELRRPRSKVRSLAVGSISASRQDQKIVVRFEDDSRGSRIVGQVSYVGIDIAHPFNSARTTLIQRFGPPTTNRPQSATWCLAGGETCDAGGVMEKDSISVRAESDLSRRNVTSIQMSVGDDTRKAWDAAHRIDLKRSLSAKDAF